MLATLPIAAAAPPPIPFGAFARTPHGFHESPGSTCCPLTQPMSENGCGQRRMLHVCLSTQASKAEDRDPYKQDPNDSLGKFSTRRGPIPHIRGRPTTKRPMRHYPRVRRTIPHIRGRVSPQITVRRRAFARPASIGHLCLIVLVRDWFAHPPLTASHREIINVDDPLVVDAADMQFAQTEDCVH